VLERLALGLGIPRGYLGLGYTDATAPAGPVGATTDPADDPGFVGTLAALALNPGLTNLVQLLPADSAARAPVPQTVTAHHVAVLREVTDQHRAFDAEHGGGSCRDSAAAYVRWASGMLHSRFTSDQVEHEFKATLADLHQVAGWACHDLGEHDQARRYLTTALALAREVGDLQQAAGCFYRLGRVSIDQHRPGEALKLWQLGQIVAQDSGSLICVAVLHANEAWAYAQLGDDARVRECLARAETELDRANPDTAPTWAGFFLAPADFDGTSALVYTTLAAHRQHRSRYTPAALEHSHRALAARRPGETRSRVFDTVSVASAHLLDAQPIAAQTHAHAAIDVAAAVASQRTYDRLTRMLRLAPDTGFDDIAERVNALTSG
jgi:tetratricopeptide (TPR) repeat protein